MDKSGIIRLTAREAEAFRNGDTPTKLLAWQLTTFEFENMINSGQIIVEDDVNEEPRRN